MPGAVEYCDEESNMAARKKGTRDVYLSFLPNARKIAYVDVSLIFSAIPISVILFDESCRTEGIKYAKTVCTPAIQDGFLLFSIISLLFAFIISKTMFPASNFHIFHKTTSGSPIILNFINVLAIVALVWFAVQNKNLLLLTLGYAAVAAAFALVSSPSLVQTVENKMLPLLVGVILVNVFFLAGIVLLATRNFESDTNSSLSASLLLVTSLHLVIHSILVSVLCSRVHGLHES
jgi:hypothetical protein